MKRKRVIIGGAVAVLSLLILVYAVPPLRHGARTMVMTVTARFSPGAKAPFPDIDTAGLTPRQARIIALARQEYTKHPVSYDQTVLKYTQGIKEAWCADFISWVMRQAGPAYSNPNSGNWRIPGVYTLQEYYQTQHRYAHAGDYRPRSGDVAFYIGRHGPGGVFSTGHVALVVVVSGRDMTTIGGNESGRLRLDTQLIKAGTNSLIGFGRLQ